MVSIGDKIRVIFSIWKNNLKPFQLIFKYTRNYIPALAITMSSMLLLVGLQLLIPWIIRTLIAAITNSTIASEQFGLVTRLTLLAFGIYILRAGLQFLQSTWDTSLDGVSLRMSASISMSICSG
jgi:ABC-type multidrug transport system fused ATPase/permease subunit